MEFDTREDLRAIRDGARELALRFDLEYWRKHDEAHTFPEEYIDALKRGGWFGICVPEEDGGSGLGMLEVATVVHELSRAGGGAVPLLLYNLNVIFGAVPLSKHATAAQREQWLRPLVSGEGEFSMALTEPDAGTNTFATQTTARREGSDWVLNGQKVFISGVKRATGMLVIARTSGPVAGRSASHGLSTFLVDPRDPGVSFQPIDKLGTHFLDTNAVFLDDVVVPDDALLGEEGRGWSVIVDVINPERIVTTAGSIGTGEHVIELACEYANERVVFDRPIGANQGIQFPLAEAKAELEVARIANLAAAQRFDEGRDCAALTNMAKLVGTKWACAAADRAIQTLGGNGYAAEFHVERHWRDLRLMKIAPVTQEMTLNYVAQHVLGLPRSY